MRQDTGPTAAVGKGAWVGTGQAAVARGQTCQLQCATPQPGWPGPAPGTLPILAPPRSPSPSLSRSLLLFNHRSPRSRRHMQPVP